MVRGQRRVWKGKVMERLERHVLVPDLHPRASPAVTRLGVSRVWPQLSISPGPAWGRQWLRGAFLVEQFRPEREPAPPRCPVTFRESLR